MTGIEQLPDDVQALKQIILRQRAELDRHDSALAHVDLNIETIQQEAAAAIAQRDASIAQRDAAIAERDQQIFQNAQQSALMRRFYEGK